MTNKYEFITNRKNKFSNTVIKTDLDIKEELIEINLYKSSVLVYTGGEISKNFNFYNIKKVSKSSCLVLSLTDILVLILINGLALYYSVIEPLINNGNLNFSIIISMLLVSLVFIIGARFRTIKIELKDGSKISIPFEAYVIKPIGKENKKQIDKIIDILTNSFYINK